MLRCPACTRAGDDLGKCGRHQTCPITHGQEPNTVDPKQDCVLQCNHCGITRVVAATSLLTQTAQAKVEMEHHCPLGAGSCKAFVLQAPSVKKAAKGEAL